MRAYHFSEHEEVAHIDCLAVKMRVIKLYWRYIDQSTGESKNDPKLGFKKERKKWFDGVECQWWEGKSLKSKRFHSHMLVPWVVAELGPEKVKEWIEEIK